jgi:putative transposase
MATARTGLLALSPAQADAALARYQLLRPALEEAVPLARLAREAGVPLRTAQRWVAAYHRQGLAGLARGRRSDRGQARGIPEQLRHCIEGLALQRPRRSLAAIQRLAAGIAREHGWRVPGYDQIRTIVRQLDPALVTLAHAGTATYADTYDLLHRRAASRPNEIWQADHTPLPINLRGADGATVRPWLTVIEDDYSRAVAGYRLTLEAPTALHTALALREAIWRSGDPRAPVCGIPAAFYTDHGSDFTSRHIEQVAADLKIQLIFSLPGQPRGRGKIERFFRTVEQLLLCQLPGYAPGGSGPVPPTLTLPAFEARFRAWLLDEYQQQPHSETGERPATRWAAGGFLPHLPASLEQLDLLLLTVPKTRRVQQDGIHFQGLRYLDPTLAAYVREEVLIRYDPADLAEIRVYHHGQFLCRAVCADLAGETIGLKEIVSARNRRRRDLRGQLAAREAVVETLLALRRSDPDGGAALPAPPARPGTPPKTRLKRYVNE